jgi:transcriptional regulator with XRE-family HTH domain
MGVKTGTSSGTLFGRTMRKARVAKGWSLREFAAATGVGVSTASMIETGARGPSRRVAEACDKARLGRPSEFTELYEEMQTWLPPGLRSWTEYEDAARRLDIWIPGVMPGLFQTPDYARALLRTFPGATEEQVTARLAARMGRQARVLEREDGPVITCVIDREALGRLVGSPEIMAAQLRRLLEIAALPRVTIAVLPHIGHSATMSGLVIADHAAAHVEHLTGGLVYIEPDRVAGFEAIFGAVRGECYRVTESTEMIREAEQSWTGGSQPTAARAAASASRPPRATG